MLSVYGGLLCLLPGRCLVLATCARGAEFSKVINSFPPKFLSEIRKGKEKGLDGADCAHDDRS